MNQDDLQTWLLSHSHGQQVLQQIQAQVQKLVGAEHYENALQLGLANVDLLSQVNSGHRHVVAEKNAPIMAQLERLPLPTESMDLVLLPLVLSQHPQRHAILREVQRVLCGYGKVIVLELNPHSLWRLRASRLQQLTACQYQHCLTPKHMADWLRLLDLQPQDSAFMAYEPLYLQQPSGRLQWLQLAGNRWWPHLAALYAMAAVKQTVYLQPLSRRYRYRHLTKNPLILNPASVRKP